MADTRTVPCGARRIGRGVKRMALSIRRSGIATEISGCNAECLEIPGWRWTIRCMRATRKLRRTRNGWDAGCQRKNSFIARLMEHEDRTFSADIRVAMRHPIRILETLTSH